jgi:hypothetical protein
VSHLTERRDDQSYAFTARSGSGAVSQVAALKAVRSSAYDSFFRGAGRNAVHVDHLEVERRKRAAVERGGELGAAQPASLIWV